MISWQIILYGAALSAVLTAVATGLTARNLAITVVTAVGAFAGPLAWNAILHATHGSEFFTDAPIVLLPASWQDTGSGVFAFAATAALLGLGPLRRGPGNQMIRWAALAGLAAFLVDVYLY